jgi:hypothetical protein
VPRVRGMHGQRLDNAVERVEGVVARVLRGIARTIAALVGASPSTAALSDDDLQPIRREWEQAVAVEIVPAVIDAYAESARTLVSEFADTGREVPPVSLDAPETADFLDVATNRLVAVSDTLWEIARKELADGIRAGEGVEELAARLQEAGGFGIARARMIARTEVAGAANAASLAQALRLDDGSLSKEWLATTDGGGEVCDERTRPAHCAAHEQIQPLGEPFQVGDTWLMYPGQPIGPADTVINCRCSIGYVVSDEPLTAAAEVHTGAMVALRPTAADAERLAVDGGEPPEQLHCTMAYLGEAADIPNGVRETIIARLRSLVEDAIRPDYDLPLVVDGFAVSMFNPPGAEHPDGRDRSSCAVLGLSGDDLDAVHKLILSTLEEVFDEHGLAMPDQHAPYNAHLTLEYTDDGGRVEELLDRAGPVSFDAVWVAFGGDDTDIPLRPVSETPSSVDFAVAPPDVPAVDDDSQPGHVGGVDLPDGGIQVDAWDDGTFSISDPTGPGLWLDEDGANDVVDALNQVRSGGETTEVATQSGLLYVGRSDGGMVTVVVDGSPDGWAFTDDDAYELSYWLAYWLERGGYYDNEGAEAAEDPEPGETLTAAPRVWDPLKHPRGPDGRFIGKGIVGRASGDAGKSKAPRRSEPPVAAPPRPAAPADPRRAELSRLRVVELRQRVRDAGGRPGRARKAELIDMLAEEDVVPPGPPQPPQTVEVPDAPPPMSPEQRVEAAKTDIRDAVGQLTRERGDYVMLADVRDALDETYDRDEVDRALRALAREPDVHIIPESNQKVLRPRERAAAVNIGNQDKHLISIVPATDAPEREQSAQRAEAPQRATPEPLQPLPGAGIANGSTPVDGSPVTGERSDRPLTENQWGRTPSIATSVNFHDDGEIGEAIKRMGADALMDVDGRPLGDVLGMLATDAVSGRSTSQEVLDKLKVLRERLPEGSAARRQLDMAIMSLDAPDTPVPDVPEGTPEPLRQLMEDLHAVPLVRRDPGPEEGELVDILAQVAAGRLSGRRLAAAVLRLRNRRHESVEGKFDIDRAVDRAVAALESRRGQPSAVGFASEDRMTDTEGAATLPDADDWDDYFATRIANFVTSDAKLREYWIHGEGAAKIRWPQSGAFDRCVRQLSKYVRDPEGLCASYYHEANGRWPGEKKDHAADSDTMMAAEPEATTVESVEEPGADAALEPLPGEHFHTWATEGVSTGLRLFAPGAITWRDPPFAYHDQVKSSAHGGVPETIQTGLVTRVQRIGDVVHFWGRLDLRHPIALDYARRLAEGWARWSSVGADESVKEANIDVEYVLSDGELPAGEEPEVDLMTFRDYRVAEVTAVSVPALADALVEPTPELIATLTEMGVIDASPASDEAAIVGQIREVEEGDFAATGEVMPEPTIPTSDNQIHDATVIVAAGHTITIPDVPPAQWFDEPVDVAASGALTVTDEGRIYGYLAPAGIAHRSFRNRRVEVPRGNVDYSRWMGGEAIVAGGARVIAGPITMNCGHMPPTASSDPGARMEHYDNTCAVVAQAAIGENTKGVWIAGALLPGVTAEQVSRMLACRLSGDWAPHPERSGWREFVAALLVPVPGFPMPRSAPSTLKIAEGALVAAAVPVQMVDGEDMEIPMEMEEAPLLAEGTPVRVLDPRDPEVTEGEIAVVHTGPAYALLVPGRDEPARWYVAEELELTETAPDEPVVESVEVEEMVASGGPDLRPVMEVMARSVGRDAASRMAALRNRVHRTD